MVKKQMIMGNALELFAKQGFEATSIQQITDKCGISKGAFYLSFKSKDELIFSLIDQFLEDLLINFEQLVKNTPDNEKLLYMYCYISLENVEKNIDLAHLFIKEASTTFNKEIFKRLDSFSSILNKFVISLLERQFPALDNHLITELAFTLNALLKGYTELFIHPKDNINIEMMSSAIEEKVTILAHHMKLSIFHSPDQLGKGLSKEQLLRIMDDATQKIESPLIVESLNILRENLLSSTLNTAIEAGLLKNLQEDIQAKPIAYLYELYKDL